MQRLVSLFRNLFHRARLERDLDDEVRSFADILTAEKLETGLAPDAARRAALIELGGSEQIKENVREVSAGAWVGHIAADVRYALRVLRRSPVFTTVTVLSLALGIGVNTTAFLYVNALVFHPLRYPHNERIMTVWESLPKLDAAQDLVSPANYLDWAQGNQSFEHLSAYRPWDASLTGSGDPERIQGGRVSPEFFDVFGLRPLLGRTFLPEECRPGRDNVVVVSYGFWKTRLGGAPNPIGQTVSIAGRASTVVGVMPNEFDFPLATELWSPLALTPQEWNDRSRQHLLVVGRLKPGISTARARAELSAAAARLERRYPQTNEGRGVAVTPMLEVTNQVTDRFTMVMLGASFFVLVLACANIANLQLARAMARRKEIAMRTALGASRFRIARQLVTETILLALAGGGLGLLLGLWDLQFMRASLPAEVYRWVAGMKTIHLDAASITFTLVVSLLAGLACCAPALYQLLRRKSVLESNEALKEGGRTGSSAPVGGRLRAAIVAGEAALALVLLVGAGLMVQTFQRLLSLDLGFNPHHVLIMSVALPESGYNDPSRAGTFYSQALDGLNGIPGVQAAGAASDSGAAPAFYIEGRGEPRPGDPRPGIHAISAGYLEAMQIPLLEGRSITRQDAQDTPPVVVLSQSIARHYWPHSSPLGHRVRFGKDSPWMTVAGVSGDLKNWFSGVPWLAAYVPFLQSPHLAMTFAVRTSGAPGSFAAPARAAIRKIDSYQPVFDLKTMEDEIAAETSGVQSASTMMAVYAVLALLLAATGIYSISAFFVVQRTHEIGIRMALGADPGGILRMALAQSFKLASLGLLIGLPLSLAMNKIMSSALYNVVEVDWRIFAAFAALLALCALLAGYIPARRAAHLDPMSALRES